MCGYWLILSFDIEQIEVFRINKLKVTDPNGYELNCKTGITIEYMRFYLYRLESQNQIILSASLCEHDTHTLLLRLLISLNYLGCQEN